MKVFDFLVKCLSFFKTNKVESKYDLISHEENFEGTRKIYGKVRVRGIGKTFYKPIAELYKTEWLNDFSREDGAFIAILYAAERQGDKNLIKLFPRKKKSITKNVVFLGMLFVSFLILSNLTAIKIVGVDFDHSTLLSWTGFGLVNFPAALVFFPLTYFFDDILTEVYGFEISRFIIWCGLICMTLISLGIFITLNLKSSPFWPYHNEYAVVFASTIRVFFASVIAYSCGEFCNSMILSKIKMMTSGKWLWLRVVSSTSIAVGIDSTIFCHIAFFRQIPDLIIWKMVLTQYVFKVSYELLALPLTYKITNYLKRKDEVDYYDYKTNFNPFSLKVGGDN